jgi:transaldolase
MYFEALLAPDTVNTMPDELVTAIRALPDHALQVWIEEDLPAAREILDRIPDFDRLVAELQQEGLASFARSWQNLVNAIEAKRLLARTG